MLIDASVEIDASGMAMGNNNKQYYIITKIYINLLK